MAISTWQGQQEPSDSQAPGQHREEPQAKQVLLNKLQERGDQGVRALPLEWFFRIFLINASSSRVVAEGRRRCGLAGEDYHLVQGNHRPTVSCARQLPECLPGWRRC